jgi:hypothetical protein
MKKGNTLLIVGAAAVALFLFKDKLFSAGGGSTSKLTDQDELPPADETTPTATETTTADAIVDASKPGSSIESALNTAKTLAQSAKDIAVLIKTPSGQKNVLLTKGKKKAKRKKCKLTRKQILANCQGLKGKQKRQCVRKTRRSCTTITIEPTQSMTFSK